MSRFLKSYRVTGRNARRRIQRIIQDETADSLNTRLREGSIGVKRKINAIIREEILKRCPPNHVHVFENVMRKSEKRDIGEPHVGRGLRVTGIQSSGFNIDFLANSTPHKDPFSDDYGWNEYWAVITAIHGRGAMSKGGGKGDQFFIPDKIGGVIASRKSNGYPTGIFTAHVAAYKPDNPNWLDEAINAIADRVAEEF